MSESILVTGKKISSMELVTNVSGNEKIPTGQPDDLAITPNQLADYTIARGSLVNRDDLLQVEGDLGTQITDLTNDVNSADDSIRGLIAAEKAARISGDDALQAAIDSGDASLQSALDAEVAARIAADDLKVDKEGSVSSVAGRVGDVSLVPSDVLVGGFGSQEDVNKYVPKPFLSGYLYGLGERVVLQNNGIVRSTVAGNTVDPNADMTGWVLVNSDSAITTWSGRTQEQKNKEFASAGDFGLVGDSETDNTSGLTDAVNHYFETKTKILLPDTGNYYYSNTSYPDEVIREAFYGGGKVRQVGKSKVESSRVAIRTTKAEGYSSQSTSINPRSDFSVSSTHNINEFKRIGKSPNNVMQGFCHDLKTDEYFTYHVSTTVDPDRGVEYGVLNRYAGSHTTGGVFLSEQSSTPQKRTGHQGLSLAYDEQDQRWFFASRHAEEVRAGAYITMFQWEASSDDIFNVRDIKLFDDSKITAATTTPATSPDGRYLVVKRNESPVDATTGQGAYRLRVFDLPKMLRSGSSDWSNDFLHEFTVESFDLIGKVLSFQGLAVGFDLITCIFGGSSRDEVKNFLTYTLDGRLLDANTNIQIGMKEAQNDDPASSYEIEALCYSYYLGLPVLYTMVSSGLSGGRIARLFASSNAIKKKFNSQVAIDVGGSINTVDITNNGDYLTGYRRGLKKLQLYTSASQTRIIAHTGNLLALVVQNDNDSTGAGNWEWRINNTGALYPSADKSQSVGGSDRLLTSVFTEKVNYTPKVFDSAGSGSPEGVLVAGVGSTYRNTSGGANTTFYVKESGTGNTGWVAK